MNGFTKKNNLLTGTEKEKLWRDDGIDYDWLVDRLEGEKNTKGQRAAYDFVLSSKGELEAYETLHHIRTVLKTCDDVDLPENGDYYQKLSDQIMSNILKEEPKGKMSKLAAQLWQKNSFMILNLVFLAMRR